MIVTKRSTLAAAAMFAFVGIGGSASAQSAAPAVGKPAPSFTATDADGKAVSLGDFKGKTVVLEWTNDECPFVKKHYGGQNMQALQKKWTGKDVVWLTVISSPPGEQGYADGAKAKKLTADRGAAPTSVVLDPKGDLGRAFKAQVTPHMYIVRGDGTLAYMGGIDDKPSTKLEDLKGAKNFVDAALTEISSGKAVSVPTSKAYGCSVKFSS